MGLTNQERINQTSKVLAGGVFDGVPQRQWYEALRGNFFLLEDGQILTQFATVRANPAASLTAARNAAAGPLSGIVDDLSQFTDAVRLTPDIAANGYQYLALDTYNDFSSARLDKWIQPQKVPQTNGQPSIGYSIQLYDGDPNSGGTLINTSDGQTGSGDTASVGWIFNYDQGILILSTDFKNTISDPYIVGFRYIGDTVKDIQTGGGGGSIDNERIFFETTQTSHGYTAGKQLTPVYKDTVSGWLEAKADSTATLAVGIVTDAPDADTLEITMAGRVTVSGHSLIQTDYYFLDTVTEGALTVFTPVSGVVQPLLWVEDQDTVIIDIQRANELSEEPPEIEIRIQGLETGVSGLDLVVSGLEDDVAALQAQGSLGDSSGTIDSVAFWTDSDSISGVNEFKWDNTLKKVTVDGFFDMDGDLDMIGGQLDMKSNRLWLDEVEGAFIEASGIEIVDFGNENLPVFTISGANVGFNTRGPNELITLDGYLSFQEQPLSPMVTPGFGKMYANTAGAVIWQRDDGTEFNLLTQGGGDIDGGSFLDVYNNTSDIDGGSFV